MSKEKFNDTKEKERSFECDGCGALFASFESLRQHEVDCKDDEGGGPL